MVALMDIRVADNEWQQRSPDLVRATLREQPPTTWTMAQRYKFFVEELEANRKCLDRSEDEPSTTMGGHRVQRRFVVDKMTFIAKQMSLLDAYKAQAVSLLANLVGVPTPLVCAGIWHGRSYTAVPELRGASVLSGEVALVSDPTSPVVRTILASRCLNEAVWNLDCWRGNFMTPHRPHSASPLREIVNIDFDEALMRRSSKWLHQVLGEKYGISRPLADCRWTEGILALDAPLTFAAEGIDSKWTLFGGFWRELAGADRTKLTLGLVYDAKGLTRPQFEEIWAPYLRYCWEHFRGHVPLQAAGTWLDPDDFVDKLYIRVSTAGDQLERIISAAMAVKESE
jgi:hypothetical protein